MTKWFWRGATILIVVSVVAAFLPGVRQFVAVDKCLDSGGIYYSQRSCRTDVQSLPAESVRLLQVPDLGSLVVALAVAVAMSGVFTTMDRRKRIASPLPNGEL
jgi:hypothetical protein